MARVSDLAHLLIDTRLELGGVFHPRVSGNRRAVVVLDACALGIFVLLGATKALGFGAGMTASVIVGLLTGIGGGIVRDLLLSEVPLVLADRQLYAIPALVGASLTAVLWHTHLLGAPAQAAVVLVVIGFRLLSLKLGWAVPGAHLGGIGFRRRGAGDPAPDADS